MSNEKIITRRCDGGCGLIEQIVRDESYEMKPNEYHYCGNPACLDRLPLPKEDQARIRPYYDDDESFITLEYVWLNEAGKEVRRVGDIFAKVLREAEKEFGFVLKDDDDE
jgi:hypothetical protein